MLFDSKKILDYLHKTYDDKIYISIMNQYTPLAHVENYPEINKKISVLEEKNYETNKIRLCYKRKI